MKKKMKKIIKIKKKVKNPKKKKMTKKTRMMKPIIQKKKIGDLIVKRKKTIKVIVIVIKLK